MLAIDLPTTSGMDQLKDKRLFRAFSYIDGDWIGSDTGVAMTVRDPATGAVLGEVAALSSEQSQRAISAASRAFTLWAAELPQHRSALLRRWYELMLEHKEDLALLMTLEQGKPLSEARGEIDYAASFLEFYAEEAKRPNIESVTSHLPGAEMEVWREPAGVAGLITPWNFPSAMITRKAGAALAAGCSVVVHPSAETPFSALALAELAERAGLPPGLFNVATGEAPDIVQPWMDSAAVRVHLFHRALRKPGRCSTVKPAGTMKRLVLELGGHAPLLVFADADFDRAVDQAIAAKFATSGQDCLAANRILVERPIYERFCAVFTEKTKALSVGCRSARSGYRPPDERKRCRESRSSRSRTRSIAAPGSSAAGSNMRRGPLFFQPTVLADVPAQMLGIFHQETFGPMAAIAPFDTEEEAIQRANETEYGLVAYAHTEDPRRIYRLSRALQFGMVAVNRTKVTGAPIPFGGMKQSGLGREGARLGMEAFMEVKYVCRDWA